VVVLVADGRPLLLQGYGFSDVARREAVDGARTLFRAGSISKLFTAIAVLQLVEQGKLDVDADVNAVLDFEIPAARGKPVTLRQLLTHRSGFEERMRRLQPRALQPIALGELMKRGLPRRSFEPERWPAYSNYGVGLAGYIVERAAGVPFATHVAAHIFAPLGMQQATFAQPLPEDLAGLLSRGYLLGSQAPGPFELIDNVPAGALSVSGAAMQRFLLALLAGGELEGRRILAPESFARMLEPQVAVAENALGLTIYEQHPYGVRLLGHSGDLAYFHAQLAFSPEHRFGVFVAQNSAGNGPLLSSVLIPALAKRYFAEPREPAVGSPAAQPGAASDVSGTYMVSRRSDATLMRTLGLVGQIRVQRGADGTLELGGSRDAAGATPRYRAVAPDRYRSLDGRDEIAFERDAQGRAVRLLVAFPGVSFERVGLVDSRAFTVVLVGAALVVSLFALIAPVLGLAVRAALRAPARSSPQLGRGLIPLTAGLWLAHVLTAAVFLQQASREFWRLAPGEDGALIAAVALAWLAAAASLAALWKILTALRDPQRSTLQRLGALVPALAFLSLTWYAWHWRLLSNPLQY
jgi:CubicO group peptidase (beta-lactamase class C family)